ncbi:hypothetical protein PLICRDRAFT_33459 [Plicaturopsis crispa FD-325 SS-3]|nr:hypothetical protein PLICRDRAFT_33459 [Plicaturopsis crispa FD-325 SS-3]
MSGVVPNLEEAAVVAADYISSLDSLPSEVQHLLNEIRIKDTATQELEQEIRKEQSRYIRHSLRSASTAAALPAKDTDLPASIAQRYTRIHTLADEKIALAERVAMLIQRAKNRLDHDLQRIHVLQGDAPADAPPLAAFGGGHANPALKITESLRNAIQPTPSPVPDTRQASPAAAHHAGPVQKKRKLTAATTNASIKLPSPAPVAPAPSLHGTTQRSRLSQQVHPPRATPSDADAEGEDDMDEGADGEEGGDQEDKEIYCFCQKLSYGEMIACDNQDCPYQWFHLPCVNLKAGVPLPEVFFCAECIRSGATDAYVRKGAAAVQRKGRKK